MHYLLHLALLALICFQGRRSCSRSSGQFLTSTWQQKCLAPGHLQLTTAVQLAQCKEQFTDGTVQWQSMVQNVRKVVCQLGPGATEISSQRTSTCMRTGIATALAVPNQHCRACMLPACVPIHRQALDTDDSRQTGDMVTVKLTGFQLAFVLEVPLALMIFPPVSYSMARKWCCVSRSVGRCPSSLQKC